MAAIYSYTVQPGTPRRLQVYGDAAETYTLKNLGPATLYLSNEDATSPQMGEPTTSYPLGPGEAVNVPYPGLSDTRIPTLSVPTAVGVGTSTVMIVAR